MIELRQLRYLIATADAGSFSRAARRLNIKQATLSRHIMSIERRLGLKLFDRSAQGVSLTTGGTLYVRHARRLVDEVVELNQWVRDSRNGIAGQLAIGFYTSLSSGNLIATIGAFKTACPDVALRPVERCRSSLVTALDVGGIDVAIMPGTMAERGLARRSVWSERLMVAAALGSLAISPDHIDLRALANAELLLTRDDPGPELARSVTSRLMRRGVEATIRHEDVSLESLLALLPGSDAFSVLTEDATGTRVPGVAFRPIVEADGEARIGFSAYWRADNENPVLGRFLDFVAARYALPPT